MAVYPIPAGRTSDALLTRRLLSQLQSEQKRMLRVEQQLSTGRRIQLPSEDTASASRAVSLQRMLEVKTQLRTNLSTNQSFLDATDTALSGVAGLLAEARGLAVRAADTTTSDLEREAMSLEIQATIRQMLDVGNKTFRNRYLFAGTHSTTRPFESMGKYIAYLGNDRTFRSYAEQDILFDTNVPGQDLFGAVSSQVQGIDLDPVLGANTRLSDLRGGLGVAEGSLLISDGTNTSTVSITGASTIGDVARLIEANPPAGRIVQATVGPQGLVIEMDAAGGGSLIISDLQGGSTAAELGIVRLSGPADVPIVGGDLDPILRLTTRLDATLGGSGVPWDYQSGLQIVNGQETYVLDFQAAETVEDLLNILNGSDAMLLAEINTDQTGINVRSRLSGTDLFIGENGGTTATDMGLRTFSRDTSLSELNHGWGVLTGAGTDFTIQRKDGVQLEVDISSADTLGDVIDLINNHPDNLDPSTAVVAGLAATGNGIQLVDNNVAGGQPLIVTRQITSYAAWDLGLVPRGEDTSLPADAPVQATAAVAFSAPNDNNTALRFVAVQVGTGLNGVDVEFRNTLVGDVATATFDPITRRLIMDVADSQTTANTVIAAVAAEGTFTAQLDLTTDPTNDGTGTIVAPPGVVATTTGGAAESLLGRDTNPVETKGVFNSLIRLFDAIQAYDVADMERIVEMLDDDFDRLNFGRAALGAHGEGLDGIAVRNEDDQVELQAVLSNEIDMDLAVAATQYSARQAAYEASLRTIAGMFRLSLLDFL